MRSSGSRIARETRARANGRSLGAGRYREGVLDALAEPALLADAEHDDGAATFLTILVIGAVIAVATLFVLQANWNDL